MIQGRNGALDLNLTAFYFFILALPSSYLIILSENQVAVPPGYILVTIFSAIVFAAFKLKHKSGAALFRQSCIILWLYIALGSIILLIRRNHSTEYLFQGFWLFSTLTLTGSFICWRLCSSSTQIRPVLAFCAAFIVPLVFSAIPVDLMLQTIHDLPYLYDPVLFQIDGILGLRLAPWIAHNLLTHPLFENPIRYGYELMLLWTVMAASSQFFYTPSNRAYLFLSSSVIGIIGYCLYHFMPAVGPRFFYGNLFPDHLPKLEPANGVMSQVFALRNAMPSLHLGTALLIVFALRDSPIWHRTLGAALLLTTVCATLGYGEHYAVDLVAAFPLVLLVRGLCAIYFPLTSFVRLNAIVIGSALLMLWVAVVRGAAISLHFPWAVRGLAALSIFLSLLFEWRLRVSEQLVAQHSNTPATSYLR